MLSKNIKIPYKSPRENINKMLLIEKSGINLDLIIEKSMKFLNIIKPTSSKAHKPMSDWGSEFPLENMKNKSLSPARSNSDRASSRVTMSNWDNDIDDDSNREIRRRRLQR